ncbi:kinase-like domain-containing protein [Zychaea mexicana]|uniref:kinase-like domain-containing protein n=1 Tax=Zychaea mexicana TaxID=64656 RepID=UPI0022FE373B|nr:kinase-like domain-containing protein [Zychaea mexicana]KAI9492871.1 kinase-like domain-containing protein [Zychaea mexicana]
MDLSYRNRNDPAHQFQQEIVKSELVHQTIQAIHRLVQQYPSDFDLNFLELPTQHPTLSVQEAISQLYNDTISLYHSRNVTFDNQWHWNVAWRQALSYESITELADGDTAKIVNSFHPKSRKSLDAIYKYDLARYMRWYPWRWFSDLVLIGSGGFSAVYAANVSLLYDVSETGQRFGARRRPVAIKVVDEKILNEIIVQSRAFLALLFHGITVCESTGDLLMIATLSENGNLEHRINKPVQFGLDMVNATDIVIRLAFNLASLHDEIGMCHRNIHPGNVLCADDDYFLVDFRFSTASNQATDVTKSSMGHYGRIPYIAPEVREGIYTEKSDVYSLGIIMWQVVSGIEFPSPELLFDAPDVYRVEWIPGVPEWYQELMMACLEPRPENRPTAEEIGLIMRKYAVSTQSDKMQVHQQDWVAYATRRRTECKVHQERWASSQTPSYVNGDRYRFNNESGEPEAVTMSSKNEKEIQMMTASRVYAFRSLPCTEFVSLPFHQRPFDATNWSDEN